MMRFRFALLLGWVAMALFATGCRQLLDIHATSPIGDDADLAKKIETSDLGDDGDLGQLPDEASPANGEDLVGPDSDLAGPAGADLAGSTQLDLATPPDQLPAQPFVPSNDVGGFVPTGLDLTVGSATFDTAIDCEAHSVVGDCELVNFDYCVCRSDTLSIGSLTVKPNDDVALILVVGKKVTITGTLSVAADHQKAGAGSYHLGSTTSSSGGAGGSHGTVGGTGGGSGSTLALSGTAELVPLVGGRNGQDVCSNGVEGGGGGAIQISAGETIELTGGGLINANGGGGGAGNAGTSCGGGGGGGAGGAVLLEAPSLKLLGKVYAVGGGGGGAGSDSYSGSSGANGLTTGFGASGGSGHDGGGCPLYGYISGGDGGYGSSASGGATDGQSGDSDCRCLGSCNIVGGGGGGGGSGRLRFNYKSVLQASGTFAPAPTYGVIP